MALYATVTGFSNKADRFVFQTFPDWKLIPFPQKVKIVDQDQRDGSIKQKIKFPYEDNTWWPGWFEFEKKVK